MLSPHLTSSIAQQHINDLHRAAAHQRLVHATRDSRRPETNVRNVFLRRLRPHRATAQPASR